MFYFTTEHNKIILPLSVMLLLCKSEFISNVPSSFCIVMWFVLQFSYEYELYQYANRDFYETSHWNFLGYIGWTVFTCCFGFAILSIERKTAKETGPKESVDK